MADQQIGEFRNRGTSPSRVEGFSDAVFGFALTLLVVSLEVPRTFDELIQLLKAIPAFAICFTLFILIWREHYVFFRRYALEDHYTVTLNSILLLVVLLYVYPLKFLFSLLVRIYSGLGVMAQRADGTPIPAINPGQMPQLMIIYGIGYAIVCLLFFLMHRHAEKQKAELQLTEFELFDVRTSIYTNAIMFGFSLLSVALACLPTQAASAFSGFSYPVLMAPTLGLFHGSRGKKRRAILKRMGIL